MMSNKIKVGIIGAGGIAQYAHIPGSQKLKDVELLAVADPVAGRAKGVAEKFNIPRYFEDPQKMLAIAELDAVSVCVPNYLHAPLTIAALEAGKHVLCEKPPAMNAKEAAGMLAAAKKANKMLMYALQRRFQGDSQMLKRFIDAGQLGEIYYVKTSYLRRRGNPGGWFSQKAKSGGGPVIDIGVHILDLVWWLMGTPKPIRVSASTYSKIGLAGVEVPGWKALDSTVADIFDVEDLATALIRFENGATVFMDTSWILNNKTSVVSTELYGTRGGAKLDPLEIYTEMQATLVDITPAHAKVSSYDAEVAHFIECIKGNKEPISNAEHGVGIMKMLDAVYKSGELLREVEVSE